MPFFKSPLKVLSFILVKTTIELYSNCDNSAHNKIKKRTKMNKP